MIESSISNVSDGGFWAEGALENLLLSENVVLELKVIEGQINSLEGITSEIMEDFSDISRSLMVSK